MFALQSINLYKECCQFHKVKPNKDILRQMDRPQLVLEGIDASRTFLGESGVKALLDCAACHMGIRKVILKKNGLTSSCIERLCWFLRSTRYLYYVDISENVINVCSARLLWETAREVPTLTVINVEGCALEEEWPRRLEQCCKSNEELLAAVTAPAGVEMDPKYWDVVFVVMIGPSSFVEKYSTEVLPPVGSLLARHRLRVCLLPVEENDPTDVVMAKVQRCKERYNHNLSWCVTFVDSAEQWNAASKTALITILRQEHPEAKPVRDMFGAIRRPGVESVTNLFVYDVSLLNPSTEVEVDKPSTPGIVEVPPDVWVPVACWSEVGDCDIPPAIRLGGKSCWKVRCQSDLYCSLSGIFSKKVVTDGMGQGEEEEADHEAPYFLDSEKERLFSLYPMCEEIVVHVERRLWTVCVPLVLIGTDIKAHSNVLTWLACKYAKSGPMKVLFYPYKRDNRTMVVFLSQLLGVLSESPKGVFLSLDMLCNEVHDALARYEGEALLIIVPSIDTLDSCGNENSYTLDWLPSTLPTNITVVVSLNTESKALIALRRRVPQPFEVLNAPLPDKIRSALFTQELARRGVLGTTAVGDRGKDKGKTKYNPWEKVVANAFLKKEGSSFTSFDIYAASLLFRFSLTTDSEDITFFLPSEVPNTMNELLVRLLQVHEEQEDALTVRYILTCLAAAALPVTEVVYVCEDLGPCPRNKTIPVLLLLIDDGIVEVHGGSIAHLAGPEVHEVVNFLYRDLLDKVNALVENHLYRLIRTRSPDLSHCFKQIGPLIFLNGSFQSAYSFVLDTNLMDAAFSQDKKNTLYAIDIIFRLLNSYRLLSQLHDGEYHVFDNHAEKQRRSILLNAVRDIQSFDSFFFQSALLMSEASPYYRAASSAEEVPYSVLAPLNTAREEGSPITISVSETPIYLHLREKYLVVSTKAKVLVYSTGNFSETVATFDTSYYKVADFRGALSAAGTRIVLVWDDHVGTLDFSTGGHNSINDVTTTLSEKTLDPSGAYIVVQHRSKKTLSVVDVTKKNKATLLPALDDEVREMYYFGSSVLLTSLYDLLIIKGLRVQKLSHTGVIRCVAFPGGDRLIASSVDEDIWIWSGRGELLHIFNAGRTPVEELCFSSNGGQLLSRQLDGLKLWETSSGRFKMLEQMYDEIPTQTLITWDDSFIIVLCGPYLYAWDASTRRHIGVLTCAVGAITSVHERNRLLIAITSQNEVKVWRLGDDPFLSAQVLQKKSLTSDWRLSGKLSNEPVQRIVVNSRGTLFAVVNSSGALILQQTVGGPFTVCSVEAVEGVVFFSDYLVFSFKGKGDHFAYFDVNESTDKVLEVLLPVDAAAHASLEFIADCNNRYLAVVSNSQEACVLYVYEVSTWSLLNQFVGHSGHVFYGFFVAEVLITACEDLTLRCWSLEKHAERASYKHTHTIATATHDVESAAASLLFFDVNFHLYYARVENVGCSAAYFDVQRVSTPSLPGALKPVQCVYISKLIVVVAEGGSVFVVNVHRSGTTSKLADYGCLCVAAYKEGPLAFVLTGHKTGEVLLNGVRREP